MGSATLGMTFSCLSDQCFVTKASKAKHESALRENSQAPTKHTKDTQITTSLPPFRTNAGKDKDETPHGDTRNTPSTNGPAEPK